MPLRVEIPASTSNLGPGFDCLGLALDLPLRVELDSVGAELVIEVAGPETHGIPTNSENLVYASLARVLRQRGVPPMGIHLRIENHIPLRRGLGSSGAAAVAGVILGHLLARDAEPDRDALLQDAVAVEGHPDNVAPSIYGGFVASARVDETRALALPLEFPQLDILLVIPNHGVSTQDARGVLPAMVSHHDAVFNVSRLGLLLAALSSGALHTLRDSMCDRLHQSHRLALVPGLADAMDALLADDACLGATVSGSGPTLLALFKRLRQHSGRTAVETLAAHGVSARLQRAAVQPRGAHWSRA